MKKRLFKIVLVVAIPLLFSGCYHYQAEYADELDIVYTNYDKTFTFPGHHTYAMPDSIVLVTSTTPGGGKTFVKPIYADQILARIKSNMTALGYTKTNDPTQAEFILMPSGVEATNVVYYYDWWSYYYGWYYPPYYGGWYYPYSTAYTYQSGSLIMNLNAVKETAADGTSPVIWIGIINGLLEGGNFTNRMNKSIDQAFTQSPYLHQ